MRKRAIEVFLIIFIILVCILAFMFFESRHIHEIRVCSASFLGGYLIKSLFFNHPHI